MIVARVLDEEPSQPDRLVDGLRGRDVVSEFHEIALPQEVA
jgi:hypothetical protein